LPWFISTGPPLGGLAFGGCVSLYIRLDSFESIRIARITRITGITRSTGITRK
jgi:hypothetical protein